MDALSEKESVAIIDLVGGVNRQFEQAIETQIKPHGSSIEQYRVLEALDRHDGQAMGELALAVFVDSPTLTRIVDRMIASGDVYRAPDIADRRRVLVFISEKGSARLGELRKHVGDIRSVVMNGLDSKQVARLRDLLEVVLHASH